ncbi:protrudin isoform X20 [Cebus imitator]|uniref:protrudin isoform X20 n=1 Tax=Cebus imitator TaxID=2715852 RepID=UPI001899D37D|nr:protrudin isoform X20 [Cebus imitator]
MRTQPQSESRPGSGDGGGVGGGDFRTCDFRTAQGGGAAFVWGWPEETLRALVPLFLLLPDPGPSLTEPAVRMQTSEREGCGPEMSPSVMPEAPLESPPFPTKSTAFDLFNLVLSYKRLEIYLEPLKDAGDGVRYLLSLIQLEAFLGRLCCTCEAAYRVLHWENPVVSSQFYGALLGMVCMLYLLPLCWVLALLNSTLFLGNVEFFRVVSEYRASLQRRMNPKQEEHAFESPPQPDFEGKGDLMDSTPALTPTESLSSQDLTPGSVEEAEEAEPDEEFKDAIEETHLVVLEDDEGAPCPAEDELALQDNGFLSKNEVLRSKVSRLTERLRKRYPTNNFGNCTGCSATFSVLKKRRSCSNCGNSFCSRCCSFKVPKSSMGATAPEAQRETVFVCASCNQTLSK